MSARSVAVLALALVGCGGELSFKSGLFLERSGRYGPALRAFESFSRNNPGHPRLAESLVRSARIYLYAFDRCPEALPLLERAARLSPAMEPWSSAARRLLLDCPDYFPLRDGMRWMYVDSQSGGRNMRLELQASVSTGSAGARIDGAYYAGKRRFQEFRRRYDKSDWSVWEKEGGSRLPILKYPYAAGYSWKGRQANATVEFRIVSDRETVNVLAGTFANCLKVRQRIAGSPAWKYDYFAPGVGRIKTTVGGSGFEEPNTELKSYHAPDPSRLLTP